MTKGPLPLTLCWHCDRALDDASALDDELERPHPGAVSLCLYCGIVGVFGEDMRLQKPTEEFLEDLWDDVEFRKGFVRFQWARQHVALKQRLLRDREDADE